MILSFVDVVVGGFDESGMLQCTSRTNQQPTTELPVCLHSAMLPGAAALVVLRRLRPDNLVDME
jgi:hypothetical protein